MKLTASVKTRRLLIALSAALALAIAGNVATLLAQAQQFPSTYERQLWRALEIWPNLLHNQASSVFEVDGEDIFGAPLKRSTFYLDADPYGAEYAALALNECTFSHFGDTDAYDFTGSDEPLDRQCKGAGGPEPPAPGALLNPVALAVDTVTVDSAVQHRVYVADSYNHRVQVFDFDGNVIRLPFQIGTGKHGIGTYSSSPSATYPSGTTGQMLNGPYGIAVDANHRILVADGGNGRIAVFNPDGSFAFDVDLPDRPAGVGGSAGAVRPNSIALAPGTIALDPASAGTPDANHRIVVTDWAHCYVYAFDAKFNLVGDLPNAIPPSPQHDACVDPETTATTQPNEFSTVISAAVDASGHIYIADHAQNAVQVFDRNLLHVGWIGKPGSGISPEGELKGPVGVAIDHLGRIGVTDAGHARVAFYSVSYAGPSAPPVANFEFQLDTTVSVSDFSMGLAEQWGTEPGLDEKGRFLATDPLARRILRFELPELGIVNASANEGEGSFDVAVPSQKLGNVLNVVVDVEPVEAGVTITSGPTPTAPVTIAPGQLVSYTFTYDSPHPRTTFTITAGGSTAEGPVDADPATAVARTSCAPACAATHTIYQDPPPASGSPSPAFPIQTPLDEEWYGDQVFIRVTPESGSAAFDRVSWYFEGAVGEVMGSGETRSPLVNGHVDVRVLVNGASRFWYWPITANGEAGEPRSVDLALDLESPHLTFNSWPAPSGVNGPLAWYNADVTASFEVNDDGSGAVQENGSVIIGGEGIGLSVDFQVFDHVGRAEDVNSAYSSGGRPVNIDRTAPTVIPPANLTVVAGVDGVAIVPATFGQGGTATDALSGVSGEVTGSGPATLMPGQTIIWTFAATDVAGNRGTATATVAASSIALRYTGATSVEYGHALPVSAILDPGPATGSLRFTLIDSTAGRGSRVVSQTLTSGMASTTIPAILNNVGTYQLRVDDLSSSVSPAPWTMATITVTPTPFSIDVTAGQGKKFGAPDPATFTYSMPALPLHPDDVITGRLDRTAGEGVGSYPIGIGTFQINSNYTIVVRSQPFVIAAAVVQVAVSNASRVYGAANPAFAVTVTGDAVTVPLNYTVSTAASATSGIGGYPITVTPGSNPGYVVNVVAGTLTVTQRTVSVTAHDQVKLVSATADPALTYTVQPATATTGLVNGNPITGSLVRAPGNLLGNYPITNTGPTPLTAGPNYVLNFTPGNLSIVSILPGNSHPAAVNDTASTSGAAPVDIAVLGNDTDPNAGDVLAIYSVTQPSAGGTVTITGNKVKFTPAPGFSGTATFSYTITDGRGGFATASVTVTVTASGCTAGTIALNATTTGAAGNIRTFAGAGVQVKASAWSRTKTTSGTWAKAILGAYGAAGLGVTDGREDARNDTHKVDNIGDRLNFVLFEFSKPVKVTRALLVSIGDDSDLTVWVGTKPDPFTNHLTLSDALILSLGTPQASAGSGSADRWAQFNSGAVEGNVLIIAADVTDTTPDDEFKLAKLDLSCGVVNQPPTVTGSARSDNEGDSVSVQIAADDANDDDLTYRATGLPPGLSIHSTTGLVTGVLSYSSAGTYNVSVTVKDEAGLSATATFAWTVVNKNRAPKANNDSLATSKNTAKTMSVIANDTDADGDTITLTAITQPSKGSVVTYSNGTVKYTPPSNWIGRTSFTYTISDGKGGTSTATVTVTVTSHRDQDECGRDHDHDGDRDRDDNRERDCDRDHRHDNGCDHDDQDHGKDCDRKHQSSRHCNDNNGWYNWRYR